MTQIKQPLDSFRVQSWAIHCEEKLLSDLNRGGDVQFVHWFDVEPVKRLLIIGVHT